jgi:hypothetical protein
MAFTVMFFEAAFDTQPFEVTVTEYKPELATVALAMLIRADVAVKPLGPLHVNVAPEAAEATVNWIVSPTQSTESTAVTLGAEGAAKLATEYGPNAAVQPAALVTVTLYTPAGTLVKSALVPTVVLLLFFQT